MSSKKLKKLTVEKTTTLLNEYKQKIEELELKLEKLQQENNVLCELLQKESNNINIISKLHKQLQNK